MLSTAIYSQDYNEERLPMKKAIPYIITLLLILVLGGAFCKLYFDHYMYTNKRADLDTYYGVQGKDDFPVIYENLVSEMRARRFGEACYMDLDTVRTLLNIVCRKRRFLQKPARSNGRAM